MPSLLTHVACTCCGHRHNFCLPVGDLTVGQEYSYLCPETGQRALLRPEATAESAEHCPQGAVQLVPAEQPEVVA